MQGMEENLRLAKDRERRLMKLLYVLKERGVPIEELYEQEVSSQGDSGRQGMRHSPSKQAVPKLELDCYEKEESEEYDSDSDLFDDAEKPYEAYE
jgi:hypothetical protein